MIRVEGNRVHLEGDIDLASRDELEVAINQIIDSGYETVVFDLRKCEFIGSVGLRAIAHVAALDVGVVLSGVPTHIRRLLRLTGLDSIAELEP